MFRRLLWTVVPLAALIYALQGGEYGTTDLWRQRQRAQRLAALDDSLRRDIDSLRAVRRAVLGDPLVQERIAREEFGMVRGNKELLYRFADGGVPRLDAPKSPR